MERKLSYLAAMATKPNWQKIVAWEWVSEKDVVNKKKSKQPTSR